MLNAGRLTVIYSQPVSSLATAFGLHGVGTGPLLPVCLIRVIKQWTHAKLRLGAFFFFFITEKYMYYTGISVVIIFIRETNLF